MQEDTINSSNRSTIQAWILASRPRTLTAAIAPVLLGSAVAFARGAFHPGAALAACIGAVMIQVGANLANDVGDYERGTDTSDRLGPVRVTMAGMLAPRQVKLGAAVAFSLAALAGAYLIHIAGWPVLVIGLASIAAGVMYTFGPSPLAYNGLGDVFTMVFFGFVGVCGTAFVQVGAVPPAAWPAAAAVGATITALLVVNNVRDIETDRRAGRRTIPVVFGRRAGLIEYALLLLVAHIIPVAMWLTGMADLWILLPVLSAPRAVSLIRFVDATEGRRLNQALADTAQLVLVHAGLFAVGLVLGSL